MDVGLYHCSQQLSTFLHNMIERSMQDLYEVVYLKGNDTSAQEEAWVKVLRDFPEELLAEPIDKEFKTLYKKAMGVFLHNVLKRKDISSVSSTRKFLEEFMSTLLKHPRMQHPPRFFTRDVYASQKTVVMDTLRSTLAKMATGLAAGASSSSVMGERAAQTVRMSVAGSVLPKFKGGRSTPTKSYVPSRRQEPPSKSHAPSRRQEPSSKSHAPSRRQDPSSKSHAPSRRQEPPSKSHVPSRRLEYSSKSHAPDEMPVKKQRRKLSHAPSPEKSHVSSQMVKSIQLQQRKSMAPSVRPEDSVSCVPPRSR